MQLANKHITCAGRSPYSARAQVPLRASGLLRRPCKPVCFKENRPDAIDDATTTRPTTSSTGVTSGLGADPMLSARALRPVDLGPVGTMMYPVLVYGTLAAALTAMFAPGLTARYIFPNVPFTATSGVMIFNAGAALIPSIVSKQEIKRAADSGILAAPAFKQLVSACLLHGVLALVVLAQAVSLRHPALATTVGGITGLATITTAYTLMKIRESGQLLPSARGLLGGMLSLLTPSNPTAFIYSLITTVLFGMGALLFTTDPSSPSILFKAPMDSMMIFLSRVMGAATLGTALMAAAVKDAADQGRQGSPLFRALNMGLALYTGFSAAAKGYALVAGLAIPSATTYAAIAFTACTALFCAYQWATAIRTTSIYTAPAGTTTTLGGGVAGTTPFAGPPTTTGYTGATTPTGTRTPPTTPTTGSSSVPPSRYTQ